ncbi:MAG: sigma-54-dependent Fis family transcriptional regulator [Cyclobacteriaceae bacterium]|nr:MAG: sigma-54-dependent Fis family transcriptional regulator [Cyclobacteriaceae bacterium]
MNRILIVDDDKDIRTLLSRFLEKEGYKTEQAGLCKEALELIKNDKFDLIVCDFKLPDDSGLDLVKKIKVVDHQCQIIMITGYSDVKIAVQAMKLGVYDYVTKPLYPDEFLQIVKESLDTKGLPKKIKRVPDKFVEGISNQSKQVLKHISLIAPTDMSVVILGETGTGKEYIARAIHDKSARKNGPFVTVDCGALPQELAGSELFGHVKGAFTGAIKDKQGSFEYANGGTLFLDEIGNLSYENQVKLLRVLQEKQIKRLGSNSQITVDVRVLTATNEDLAKSVREGNFREDLFYRFNEFTINLTPLRERKSDIMVYAQHFLNMANRSLGKEVSGFHPKVSKRLQDYYWHGNLRELKNVVKRAVLLCAEREIIEEHLPEEIVNPIYLAAGIEPDTGSADAANLKSISEIAERQAILDILEKTGNNKTMTANILKIHRKTLYNKLKAYNIEL